MLLVYFFIKYIVFLFWPGHRGEGWGSGQSTRLQSIWPGFRSCHVCHIWVRDRSLFIAWVRGQRILEGITWFLGEQKGVSVVTENPKAGIVENVGRIQSGDHSNLLGKWRRGGGRGGWAAGVGGGRSWKSSKVIRGDHFNEVTLKGGIG